MAGADDPSSFASPDPSEHPSLDEFGPPHDHSISETLQLWILIPGLIGLIFIGEYIVHVLLSQVQRPYLGVQFVGIACMSVVYCWELSHNLLTMY